jgi:hypothetical protein
MLIKLCKVESVTEIRRITVLLLFLQRYCPLAAEKLPKKIYRLKEDQPFSLLLELGWKEKVARHQSADFLLHSIGGGGDFVDTVIAVKMP